MDEKTRQATRYWTLAQPAVSAFVTSVVRDFRDRDDVLQDIAVAVVESFERWDSARPFVAWAMGIARNQVGLYLRRRRRDRQMLEFDTETVNALVSAFSDIADEDAQPQLDFLQECLKRLEGRARKLCELRYQQDLKPAAISNLIGMTANAVAKSLERIREQLRDCIVHKAAAQGTVR
ncbi:MAG: sigma-70 family RNA polymerase sigma factor [Planctomycetaceae bacterium]|nr:sigma-70 family RNA polymerase sigma factor [Planctomycetaceae bacterium]